MLYGQTYVCSHVESFRQWDIKIKKNNLNVRNILVTLTPYTLYEIFVLRVIIMWYFAITCTYIKTCDVLFDSWWRLSHPTVYTYIHIYTLHFLQTLERWRYDVITHNVHRKVKSERLVMLPPAPLTHTFFKGLFVGNFENVLKVMKI